MLPAQERAIDAQELIPVPGQPRISRIRRSLLLLLRGEFVEDLLQQLGIHHLLSFREAGQAHRSGANLLLHAVQAARGAQSPHRSDHGIEEAKEQQAQVILLGQPAARIGERPAWPCGLGLRERVASESLR